MYFWHSEGWTSISAALLEAVLKRTRTTKHPWLIACDANMSPEDFEKSLRFGKDQVHVIAPQGVSMCRSKNAKGEWVEKVYDYVIASCGLKGKISDMKVIEDFESRPHKAVTFVSKEERKDRNGTSKNCRRRYLVTLEEDYQEEARKKKEGKKRALEEFDLSESKRTERKNRYKDGIARRLRMKKKRKAGKKATKWQNNGKRSNIWKT